MMKKLTRSETAAFLSARDSFCILTHRRPDGDTIGAATTLCLGLRQLGKKAHVLENGEASPFMARCLEGLTKPEAEENDTIVSVDVASPGMLPEAYLPLQEKIVLRLDHHGSATSFTEFELVDPATASCGEIVYDVLMEMGAELDQEMAWRLYIALSTDTGCFRFANTNAHTYQVAAACAATGANLYPITQELFDTNSLSKLRLQSWMLDHAVFLADGKAAVCAIPKSLEETVSKEDLEGISGFLRSIEGIKICATIRENQGGAKMSVRAVPGYDAAAVCAKFGGGGHKGAAGTSMNLSLEDAAKEAAAALEALMEEK